MTQLLKLTPTADTGVFTQRLFHGRVLSGLAGASPETAGAVLPSGSRVLETARGQLEEGDRVVVAEQMFEVTGVEPLGPFFSRELVSCERRSGVFTRIPFERDRATIDGDFFLIDGDRATF